ncbi:cyclic nucleotide-binding domain-containing protein [Pseudodesulfovibrio sp. JC047]|uniref:Crp/Fnr family transcriptional regulator n=1 Tax=Pseudodesulfovibrio sp. JC047 TaxID=2683199 RepID=UPI0013D6AD8B|nr:Crp/Fnr family transcriptional regulator [Pseudodesulfovibrio sp. JC047]NDV18213.1 cyclic nucleotide-binding domain-containing protein [Pseudodesulfovibrio sp. JC047]
MQIPTLKNAIRNFPIFSQLQEHQLDRLASHAEIMEFPKRSLFFSEDNAAHGLHVLLSGLVKLFKISEDGKEQTIFLFGPGEPFCLCSAFSDGRLPANLAALEKSTVLFIPPKEFDAMVREDPSILLAMMRVMSRRLKEAMDMIDSLSLKQIPSRLMAYFETHHTNGLVSLDISHRELAKIIGITPEALSRTLKKMVDHGSISMDGTDFVLADIPS